MSSNALCISNAMVTYLLTSYQRSNEVKCKSHYVRYLRRLELPGFSVLRTNLTS